jgi:photosystem II stability/assembly factor-like uncharacterized protein
VYVNLLRAHTRRAILTIVEIVLLLGILGPAHAASLDPLDRRSVTMLHPERGVLLSLTAIGRRLVAVGAEGLIILSDDYGVTWRQVPTPVSVTLTSVAFANNRAGWAVGHSGVVLETQDGGNTWSRQYDGRQLIKDLMGRAGSAAHDAKGDQGNADDAAQQMIDDGPDKPLLSVLAIDAFNVIAVGSYGLILVTHNGGTNWEPRLELSSADKGKHLYAVQPLGDKLFFAGESGGLFTSEGINRPLVAIPSPYLGTFFGLIATTREGLIAFGLRGHAVTSSDGGRTWTALEIGTSGSINAGLRMSDGRIVLATESGEILVSQDGSKAFRAVTVSTPSPYSGLVQTPTGLIAVGFQGIVHINMPDMGIESAAP